jgi:arylsulfatase A-like enzyme
MRLLFLVLDGMPPRRVGPAVTPALWSLVEEGGTLATGRAVMASATYPNHATFSTGTEPEDHGIVTNWLVRDGRVRPAWELGPRGDTIFDACRRAGRSSAAVLGDQNLVGVMGAATADAHWPPEGVLGDEILRDGHGYAADDEVLPRVLEAWDEGPDLLVGHLNEPDTAGHVHGPDSDAAAEGYRRTDAVVGRIVEHLRSAWHDTVVVIVSDHDQETVDPDDPVDLYGPASHLDERIVVIPEGGAAVAWGDDAADGSWLDAVEGVAGHRSQMGGAPLVWAEPGRYLALPPGFEEHAEPGQHGGPGTRDQVALVTGGHPAAAMLGSALRSRRPEAGDWAPTIAALLGTTIGGATGRSLA